MDGDFIFAAIYSVETMAIYKYDTTLQLFHKKISYRAF